MSPRNPSTSSNQGIQGNVTADVVAVGRNATATKTVLSDDNHQQLIAAIKEMEALIAKLQVPSSARDNLNKDVSQLQHATAVGTPDPQKVKGVLETIVGKLKMFGDATKEAADLIGPIGKIAGLFHLSLAALGL